VTSGQRIIWELTKRFWEKTGREWPKVSLGTTLGCGLSNYTLKNGRPDTGLNRLYTILISESTYLIWRIRCEWKISHEGNPCWDTVYGSSALHKRPH